MDDSSSWQQKFLSFENSSNVFFNDLLEQREKWFRDVEKETDAFGKLILKSLKSGDSDLQICKEVNEDSYDESDQENVPLNKRKGHKKKPVLSESTQNNLRASKIKKEKISLDPQPRTVRSSTISTKSRVQETPEVPIKAEMDDMPAPSWIPPKKKTKEIKVERASVRATRTKGKKQSVRDSDVVVQSEPVTTISLSDTEESDSEKLVQKPTRSTRTKTKTKTAQAESQSQSDSGPDTESESSRSTRTKTRNKKPEQNSENVEVEESRSTRTKTLRKGKKGNEDQQEEQDNAPQETRTTRTKTIRKGTKAHEETASEVIDGKEEPVAEPTRSTRTKTRKMVEKPEESIDTTTSSTKSVNSTKESGKTKAAPEPNNQAHSKRNRSNNSTDEEANEKKRSKSSSPVQKADTNTTTQTVYEDAQSTLGLPQDNQQHLNATYVASVPHATAVKNNAEVPPLDATVTVQPTVAGAANSTVVLDKPNFNIFDKKSTEVMFTDDDSDEAKTPPKKAPASKASKEVFSPYEKTTLKKKVEAFEKLQNGSEIPVKSSSSLRNTKGTPSAVREKAKMFTPSSNRFMPSSSSTSKISKFISYQGGSSSNESLLAMKSAQKESRERQKKQLEREQALKKKEAMLLAQAEAKKKANEEKQFKAAQQRKVLEVEKQKQLEQQKLKEAKLRQKEREREEYLQKQKQELEKKRAAQKKKVQEMQLHRQQVLEEQARNPPVYMTSKPPQLPTEDCYDSDDPEYRKVTPPSWCVGEVSRTKQLAILAAGEKIKNTLFCRHAQTPDLTEIFEVIDPKKLKRTSSVLWRKPPRYTMMPDLNETKFEEDDELFESD